MKNRIIRSLFFIGAAGLLLSCSHENPLKKNSPNLSGNFLYQASQYAEIQLNAGEAHDGFDYGKCIEGDEEFSLEYCNAVYEKIVNFAKNKNGVFKELIVNDLTDANVYYQVKGYYDNQTYINKSKL